jgi:hypothetical protein
MRGFVSRGTSLDGDISLTHASYYGIILSSPLSLDDLTRRNDDERDIFLPSCHEI